MKNQKISINKFIAFIVIMTLYMCYKIHYGLHYDEAYLVDLGKLKMDGIKNISECWDILQMSGLVLYPFIKIFHFVNGNYEGVILFFRYVYIFIHMCVSIYAYYTIKRIWAEMQAIIVASVSFMYSFYWYTICYRSVLFWGTFLTILFFIKYIGTNKDRYICFSAISFCVSVIFYPTLILMFIPFALFLLRLENGKRKVIIFFVTCLLIALIIVLGLIGESGIDQLLKTYMLSVNFDEGLDNSHKIVTCIEILSLLVGGFIFHKLFFAVCKKMISNKANCSGRFYKLVSILSFFLLLIIIGLRPASAGVSRFQYILILMFFFVFPESVSQKGAQNYLYIKYLFLIPSIILMFIIAISTANGIAIASYGVVFGLMGEILLATTDETISTNGKMLFVYEIILFYFVCMIYFVPDMELGSSNITWDRYKITQGPGKGIFVTKDSLNKYNDYFEIIDQNVSAEDKLFILDGGRRSYGFLSTDAKQVSNRPYVVYPYSERSVEYFLQAEWLKPTIVIVNKEYVENYYISYSEWEGHSALGEYINHNYELIKVCHDKWYIYRY